MQLYAVMKRPLDNDLGWQEPKMLSTHDDEGLAIEWAEWYCSQEYPDDECEEITGLQYLEQCDIPEEPVFAPHRLELGDYVFYVRKLANFNHSSPPQPQS